MGNSVIYRPAYDAEVEYLESTGTQYIDTGIVFNSPYTIELSFMLTKLNNYNSLIFGAWHDNDSTDRLQFYVANNNRFNNDGHSNITGLQPSVIPDTNTIYNITYTPTISQPDANSSMWLFARNNDRSMYLPYNRLRVYSCKIKDIDSDTVIRDFIPVRIGSTGYIYDKVTKQLFANKGTGNFILGNDVVNAVIPQQRCVLYFGNQRSVGFERIYEEYEWLKGDGKAYIDTLVDKLKGTITVDIDRTDVTSNSNILGREAYPGLGYESRCVVNLLRKNNNYIADIYGIRTTYGYGVNIDMMDTLYLDLVAKIASTKSGNSTSIDIGTDIGGYNMLLFAKNSGSAPSYCWSGSIGSFKMADVIDLTPVHLLRPIPAILDGNGIARQAGECGMWDKVSNKFYGNVSESGTFTVKGPKCYEEYKWLRIDINTMQYAQMMNLPINSYQFSFKRKWLRQGTYYIHSSYFVVEGYSYFTNGNIQMLIWDGANATQIYNSGTRFNLGDTITINCNAENYNFDEVSMPIYGVCNFIPFDCGVDNPSVGADIAFLTSSITIDGSVRYVPCKLTHGIPASMDANGIARPAGTCGMWDKVNDKFYGNVESSGTFTVSND